MLEHIIENPFLYDKMVQNNAISLFTSTKFHWKQPLES